MTISSPIRAHLSRHDLHVSFEFFPPKTVKGQETLLKTASNLAAFQPDFISVTFGAGGSVRTRTLETCLSLHETMNVDVVPHISCLGLSRETIKEHLEKYRLAGIETLLAIRGDVPRGTQSVEDVEILTDGFRYANELVSFIKEYGGFHVLVACYPEGHPESTSFHEDMDNFIRKVEAGADVGVTQYFFNNAAYFKFVEEIRRRGFDIPLVVGLMPLYPYEQVVQFSKGCSADVPLWIRKRMEDYMDDASSQFELGVELMTQQAEELIQGGAPGIHFYTLNRSEMTARVCKNLMLKSKQIGYGLSFEDVAYDET